MHRGGQRVVEKHLTCQGVAPIGQNAPCSDMNHAAGIPARKDGVELGHAIGRSAACRAGRCRHRPARRNQTPVRIAMPDIHPRPRDRRAIGRHTCSRSTSGRPGRPSVMSCRSSTGSSVERPSVVSGCTRQTSEGDQPRRLRLGRAQAGTETASEGASDRAFSRVRRSGRSGACQVSFASQTRAAGDSVDAPAARAGVNAPAG